ncbi:hypothetical protein EIP86_004263 [Pleurotus ostreatoroseus]|nr:hypothetical protein EIP86_004263 [Pleurotus ostreatoroseus]
MDVRKSLSSGSSGSQAIDGNLSEQQVRKLSDKLEEVLGNVPVDSDGAKRNEKGELVNEDGLPIIDINEPIDTNDAAAPNTDQLSNFDDPGLLPLWTLSPAEKARRRAERDRILDVLEEEERLQQTREAEATRAQWHQEMEKRKEAAKTEMENLKRARELQKKMGRALLRSVVESKERDEENEKADMAKADREAAAKRALKPKKSVSFADEIAEEAEPMPSKGKEVDWGDVALGRLRTQGQSSLLTKDREDKLPMKMHVIERHPRAMRSPEPPAQDGDSDDESAAGSLAAADSEDGEIICPDFDSADEDHIGPPTSDPESEDGLHGDEHDEWGGDDFDYAQHQREIALEYYEKRRAIGAETAGAMRAHTHDEDEWDQPEVPLEATLASAGPKPSMSRFRAERSSQPKGSSLASHSLEGSVLPSSHSASLKGVVRMGKLEAGQLVGGDEGESDGEADTADENTKAMLEMLKNGEITNIGPAPVSITDSEQTKAPIAPAAPTEPEVAQPKPSKVSKFKMSFGQSDSSRGPAPGVSSPTGTPIDQANRSSPKMQSIGGNTPSPRPARPGSKVVERHIPSTIIESPSFLSSSTVRQQAHLSQPGESASAPAFQSIILESPSYQPPLAASQPPAFHSVVLEPPSVLASFAGPSPVNTSPSASTAASAQSLVSSSTPLRSAVVERRPPSVVASRENQGIVGDAPRKQKVSRFKSERTQ